LVIRKTDIQPSIIKDLKIKVNNKYVSMVSKSTSVDTGKDSESGMEDLPFDISFRELRKIVKEAGL